MNTDQLGQDLKDIAETWTTPTFDSAELRAQADSQRARNRNRLTTPTVAALLVGGVLIALTVTHHSEHATLRAATAPTAGSHTSMDDGPAPAAAPPVVITASKTTGQHVGLSTVLARTPAGTPVTVHAGLHFTDDRPARVRDAVIIIAKPGTQPAAAPFGTGSDYASTRIAISARVHARSPQKRTLAVSTPPTLTPGNYPVLTVMYIVLPSGQNAEIHGSYSITSELGVISVTAP